MTNNADIKKRNFLTQNEIESLLKRPIPVLMLHVIIA